MPSLPIVDAHHHLWDLSRHSYPWLSTRPLPPAMAGDVTPIAKSYLVDDFLADCKNRNVVKSVHVEAGFDPSNPVAETRWLQEVADQSGFPHGIVAKAELQSPNLERLLEEHRQFANVRGIRHMISWHRDPSKTFIDRPDLLTDDQWLQGFALLKKCDLSFDLQIYPPQMQDAVTLAERHPDTSIILDHSGMPVDRDMQSIELWRKGMKELAKCDNVTVKISGLGMFDHSWTIDSIQPFVEYILETFGTKRCMFASNFPVDKLYSSFDTLFDAFKEITRTLSTDEQSDVFSKNAERIYRI